MRDSFFETLQRSGAHQVGQPSGGREWCVVLGGEVRFQNLVLPQGTTLWWDGENFPAELVGPALAKTRIAGLLVVEGSRLCIAHGGYYWSAVLADDGVICGVKAPRGSRVEWLYGIDTFACESEPRAFQVELPEGRLHADAFDVLQFDTSGKIDGVRAALDIHNDRVSVRKGMWLLFDNSDPAKIRHFTNDRGRDPAMRHYDGSGGADV